MVMGPIRCKEVEVTIEYDDAIQKYFLLPTIFKLVSIKLLREAMRNASRYVSSSASASYSDTIARRRKRNAALRTPVYA
jgi:hypothetical protein